MSYWLCCLHLVLLYATARSAQDKPAPAQSSPVRFDDGYRTAGTQSAPHGFEELFTRILAWFLK
jgi:hypothetical protein